MPEKLFKSIMQGRNLGKDSDLRIVMISELRGKKSRATSLKQVKEPHGRASGLTHRVEAATDDVEWYLEFCMSRAISPKYNTNPVHSSARSSRIVPGKASDLGCRQDTQQPLFIAASFDVTAA